MFKHSLSFTILLVSVCLAPTEYALSQPRSGGPYLLARCADEAGLHLKFSLQTSPDNGARIVNLPSEHHENNIDAELVTSETNPESGAILLKTRGTFTSVTSDEIGASGYLDGLLVSPSAQDPRRGTATVFYSYWDTSEGYTDYVTEKITYQNCEFSNLSLLRN